MLEMFIRWQNCQMVRFHNGMIIWLTVWCYYCRWRVPDWQTDPYIEMRERGPLNAFGCGRVQNLGRNLFTLIHFLIRVLCWSSIDNIWKIILWVKIYRILSDVQFYVRICNKLLFVFHCHCRDVSVCFVATFQTDSQTRFPDKPLYSADFLFILYRCITPNNLRKMSKNYALARNSKRERPVMPAESFTVLYFTSSRYWF